MSDFDVNVVIDQYRPTNDQFAGFVQLVLVHGENSPGVRLAQDFLNKAIEHAINGDVGAWAACLRLAGEFATAHWQGNYAN